MPGLTIDIKRGGKLHQLIIDEVRDRIQFSKRKFQGRHKKWIEGEERALAFLPEREVDAKRRLKREGGMPQYTTIQIPYSYAILMTSHAYWTTVFMSRSPVLQYSGRHGESEMQIQALEALIDYQMLVGNMMVPLYLWLLDQGKYGLGVIGEFWDEEEITTAEIVEEEAQFFGPVQIRKARKRKITKRVPGYVGNKLYNIRPFDFFPDPRVPTHRFQEGEFCGVYGELGWNTILRRAERGIYTNLEHLRPGERGGTGEREAGSAQLELPDADEFFTSNPFDKKASDVTKIYECHIDLIPSKWKLGKGDMPEKWVFTVTSDFKIVIGAQPLGAWHNKFPFDVLEFEPEAYSIVPRGIPEILQPIQNTIDWLFNSHIYNVRKTLNNQFVVDPSRVVMKDMQDGVPGGIIRLKPSAYGTDPKLAFTQVQTSDVTQNHLRDMQVVLDMGQRTLGVSDAILGLQQRTGRRSATETRQSTTFGINRLKTVAEYQSAMGWAPMSQKLVQNSQQYYDMDRKFRIVGDLIESAGPSFVRVDPAAIQGFYDFVPIDGTLPVDRFAQANLWRELLAQMKNVPGLVEQYDVARIFAWVAQLAGLKNINRFKIEIAPDGQLAAQAQQGNVIPIPGAAPVRAGLPDLNVVPEPGQVGGLGTT